jgi:uracil-DNA glycosylase
MTTDTLANASNEALACRVCEAVLPLGPRPVFRVSETARVLIIGQAPGKVGTRRQDGNARLYGWTGSSA